MPNLIMNRSTAKVTGMANKKSMLSAHLFNESDISFLSIFPPDECGDDFGEIQIDKLTFC